ncbi:MAG: hypothetical protein AABX28_03790 [Nanoarchaeota archaeon]
MEEKKIRTVQEIIEEVSPYYAGRKKKKEAGLIDSVPETEHKLVYDSSSETLEPMYFFILDLMNGVGLAPEKLVDNFSSTPGSGHFAELGQRATIMQQQATRILGDVNNVLRSVLNLIYDLKEFKTRLQSYSDMRTNDKEMAEAAKLTLKQIWLDKVDFQKGNTSIKAMAFQQVGAFQTLIDAFLVAKDEKDVDAMDLNERVKRILRPRIREFNIWLTQSEMELKKRYELERNYLRSQVNSLKLYSRWAKPYLKAAQQLESSDKGLREPALVKAFNTILFELSLFGKSKVDTKKAALEGNLPADFQKLKTKRDYFSCVLVNFRFRGIPQRVGQQANYVFGGRAEISFIGYALNQDEINKINKELEKSDVEDVLQLIEGITNESLGQLQEEINMFLEDKTKEPEKTESKKASDTSNPFLALTGYYNKKETSGEKEDVKKKDENKPIRSDDWLEKTHLRALASKNAKNTGFILFDVYKASHGMVSYT